MFSTTLAAAALTGLLSANANAAPTWHADYSKALSLAAQQQKPIAVLIAAGDDAASKLAFSDAAALLRNTYVPVMVNTETAEGKAVAGAFKLDSGLVISTRGGSHQALRAAGALTDAEVAKYLATYADTPAAAAAAAPATQYVGCAGGSCGVPVSYGCAGGSCGVPVSYGFAGGCSTGGCGSVPYYGGFGGGCGSSVGCGSHGGFAYASCGGASHCGGGRGHRGGRGCR